LGEVIQVVSQFDGSQPGPPVGYFGYVVATDSWSWSDGIYELHGYAPRSVEPSTQLMLQHKHPEDRVRAYEVLEQAVEHGHAFSCYHRIVDAKGAVRSVLSVGRGLRDDHGRVEQLVGFFCDLSDVRDRQARELEETVLALAQRRVRVEQAKGCIMFALGCSEEEAFEVLRHRAAACGGGVQELADRLVGSLPDGWSTGASAASALTDFLERCGQSDGRRDASG